MSTEKAESGVDQEGSTARTTDAHAAHGVPDWVSACRATDPNRQALHKAVLFQYEGETWTGATNGHRMGAVRGACDSVPTASEVGAPDYSRVLIRPTDAKTRHEIRVADLRQFLGTDQINPDCENCDGEGSWECDDCSGGGEVEHECICGDVHEKSCEACGGRGVVRCETCLPSSRQYDYGRIFDRTFDRNTLRPVLAKLPYETCYFDTTEPEHASWLYDDSGDWLLLVMPLRDAPRRDEKLPAFPARELVVDPSRSTPEEVAVAPSISNPDLNV